MKEVNVIIFGLIFLVVHNVQPINSEKILGFFSTSTRSHLIIHESLMRELAGRGHNVTIITTLKQSGKPLKNYRYIEVQPYKQNELDSYKDKLVEDAEKNNNNPLVQLSEMLNAMTVATSHLLNSYELSSLKNEKFDLIVFGWFLNDFQIGLASHFNAPSVIISVIPNTKVMRDYVGNPTEISSVPSLALNINGPMTFIQRVQNFLMNCLEFIITHLFEYFVMEPLYAQHFPSDKYPSYEESKRNVSLVLFNQHFSQATPTALVPAMIEFSGMHIKRQPDPLPEDIKEWLDNAVNGAILFSMGTNVKGSQLSLEKRSAIIRTFANMKERILWNFDEDLPNMPSNVMIKKWLPQDDVLAHQNVKLFISHGGKGGLSEAQFHGVPVLGMPIFGDQLSNINIAVYEGWAVRLLFSELNDETFSTSLNEILNNATYTKVIKQLSTTFRDRPQHPLDNAVFWVEYVIRHHGAKHLQSPAVHLNFFQYYSLDVIAVLLAVIYLSLKISKCALKMLLQKCFGRSNKKKTE